ncbi:MAG: zf-TFIIB domain-containing protein [Bacteriovoracia bacterium]
MKCPSCPETRLVISERKGIEIDYCPDCRGVWLDRGELDKILERSKEEDRPQPQRPPYPDNRSPEYHKPYKRKKSIFEELFD